MLQAEASVASMFAAVEETQGRPRKCIVRVLRRGSIRGVYIQRNQVGLMIDAAACIVGDKPGEAQITFL